MAELGDPIYDEDEQADSALHGQIPRRSLDRFPHHLSDHVLTVSGWLKARHARWRRSDDGRTFASRRPRHIAQIRNS